MVIILADEAEAKLKVIKRFVDFLYQKKFNLSYEVAIELIGHKLHLYPYADFDIGAKHLSPVRIC